LAPPSTGRGTTSDASSETSIGLRTERISRRSSPRRTASFYSTRRQRSGNNIQRAVDEIAKANGVSNKVTHLVYSHHHADHAGRILAVCQRGRPDRPRGDAPAPHARQRPRQAFARGDLQRPPHPEDRRRAHRAGLAWLKPLAGQHLHSLPRSRHPDAHRHRQPGMGAGIYLQPHRGRARLRRGARHRTELPVESTTSEGHLGRLGNSR